MNKVLYILPALAVSCLVPVGFISAQTDSTPSWVKSNAGLWADEMIDDGTFLAGIEFLIDNGIITVNQQDENSQHIQELEEAIAERDNRIQQLEGFSAAELAEDALSNMFVRPAVQNDAYITTDKKTYTLGDTIHITGKSTPKEYPEYTTTGGETIPYRTERYELNIKV